MMSSDILIQKFTHIDCVFRRSGNPVLVESGQISNVHSWTDGRVFD